MFDLQTNETIQPTDPISTAIAIAADLYRNLPDQPETPGEVLLRCEQIAMASRRIVDTGGWLDIVDEDEDEPDGE